MYLRYLTYFITVAECKNFTRAAEKLNTVQPSISRQIKRLEEIVGVPLIIRSPHELELTSSGEVFLEQAKIILRQFEQAKILAQEAAMAASNNLNIGLISGTEQPFFEKVLTPAKQSYPDLTVNLTSRNELELVKGVKEGTLDAGFLIGPERDPDLNYYRVCKQNLVVAISQNDPLASKPRLTIADLTNLPLYLPKDEDSPFYSAAIKDLLANLDSKHLDSSIYCDSAISAMQSICMNDKGCCFISDFQAHIAPCNVVVKELITDKQDLSYDLVLITSNNNQSHGISKLVQELV